MSFFFLSSLLNFGDVPVHVSNIDVGIYSLTIS